MVVKVLRSVSKPENVAVLAEPSNHGESDPVVPSCGTALTAVICAYAAAFPTAATERYNSNTTL